MADERRGTAEYAEMWCPWGRLCIQKGTREGVDMASGGAFNATLFAPESGGPVQFSRYLTSRCAGPKCPYYHRPGAFTAPWGRCGLERPRHGMALAFSMLALAASCAALVWRLM